MRKDCINLVVIFDGLGNTRITLHPVLLVCFIPFFSTFLITDIHSSMPTYLPPPTPPHKKKMHKQHCFQFLLPTF